jgi:phosphate transport system substrate-binding protein
MELPDPLKENSFMKRVLAAAAVLAMTTGAVAEVTIQGAGATFPAPIYSQWANEYNKITGMKLNYQSIGSGGGIAQIKAGTVDFGASDAPLKEAELKEAGLVQFPMIVGGVVPVVNIEGIKPGELTLSGELLADIYLGKISKWNDAAIRKINPGVALPDADINVVARSDGSGTTWIYTTYLSEVSSAFKDKVGAGKAVKWPVGSAAKGNEGVAVNVKQNPGAIGYVEYAYALQNKMAYTCMQNKAGKAVEPTLKTFQAAAASADWTNAAAFYVVLVNQPGEHSWPIAGASFILVHGKLKDAGNAKAMLSFFAWCFKHGDKMAEKIDYVPLPDSVVSMVEAVWAKDLTTDGKAVWPIEKTAGK